MPVLRNERLQQPTHPFIVHQALNGQLAIRQGPWKWIEDAELFDLSNDQQEIRDLADQRPEVVEAMRKLLRDARANGRSAN